MNNKVSIIIPIYNCERFLQKCLETILNQKYENIEVILVDDGSTDNSLEICKQYEKIYSKVKVIEKENGGVSSARNAGLLESTGEFVLFVDGDDYIEKDCISKCMDIIIKNNIDIIKFGFVKELSEKITKKYSFSVELNKKIIKSEYKKKLYPYVFSTNDFCNTTNAIIKKSIIKDTIFPLNRLIGEDFLFFFQCLNNSESVYFINEPYYHYIVNTESATHKFDEEKSAAKLSDSIYINTEIQKILSDKNYNDYSSYIKKCDINIYSNIQVCILNNNYKKFCAYIDRINNDVFLKEKIIEFFPRLSKKVQMLLSKNKKIFYLCKIKNSVKNILKKIASKIG